MDKIGCVIIDDEARSRNVINSYINEFIPELEVLGTAHNVESGVELITSAKPDLVFLDISMPDGSGFELLDKLPKAKFSLVFVTAYDNYAIKAFDYAALFYLMKPVSVKDLEKVVERHRKLRYDDQIRQKLEVLKSNQKSFSKIALPVGNEYEFIEVSDILRCEASTSYTSFYMAGGKKLLVSKSIANFEKLLPQTHFFRIHKKHLINLTHVTKYVKGKTGYVILSDGSHADVAYRRKDEFIEKLRSNFGFA